MAPKQKADELYEIYTLETGNETFAIKCALITVDEIMDFLYEKDLGYMYYWEDVKREIYNL